MTLVLLAGWWLAMLLSTASAALYVRRVRNRFAAPAVSGAAVLVPIKGRPGEDAAVEALLAAILAQLGDGRLLVAVESRDDPAAAPVARAAAADGRVCLVVAGRAAGRGQKVHNLLAALERLRPGDRSVVFADADLVPAPDWLGQLLRPISTGRADLTSGYRWILPDDGHLASRLAALMDWSVATVGRSRRWNLAWGGSTALARGTLDRIDLPRRWSGALLDDLVLTAAARDAGVAVHAPHQVLVPSPVRHGWRSLGAFGRRQYLLVRVHAPLHWWVAGATLAVPVAGAVAAPAAGWPGIATLAAALVLQQVRASLRVAVARRVLPPDAARRSAVLMARDRWLLPAAHLLHLAIWLSSAAGRTMDWAGTRYRLHAPDRVEVLGRPGDPAPLL